MNSRQEKNKVSHYRRNKPRLYIRYNEKIDRIEVDNLNDLKAYLKGDSLILYQIEYNREGFLVLIDFPLLHIYLSDIKNKESILQELGINDEDLLDLKQESEGIKHLIINLT